MLEDESQWKRSIEATFMHTSLQHFMNSSTRSSVIAYLFANFLNF